MLFLFNVFNFALRIYFSEFAFWILSSEPVFLALFSELAFLVLSFTEVESLLLMMGDEVKISQHVLLVFLVKFCIFVDLKRLKEIDTVEVGDHFEPFTGNFYGR